MRVHWSVSKDGSKFWSSQMWRHFLTHAKHFDGECNSPSSVERGGEAQLKVIISSGEAKAKRRAAAAIWGRKVRKDWLIKDHFLYIRTIVPPYFMYKVHTAGLSGAGQKISKANNGMLNSSKKRTTNEKCLTWESIVKFFSSVFCKIHKLLYLNQWRQIMPTTILLASPVF